MSSDNNRFTGRVKWFNNQAGYGFITSRVGGEEDRDVFVHHSSVSTQQDQFRYLVQGEYVSFVLSETQDEDAEHRTTAKDVRGADGGMLMCETRLERRSSLPQRTRGGEREHIQDRRSPRSSMRGAPRGVQHGRREGGGRREDGVEWVLVRRRNETGGAPSRGRGGARGRSTPRTHQPRVHSS